GPVPGMLETPQASIATGTTVWKNPTTYIPATLSQNCFRLSVPPNSVVNTVESTRRMCPPRFPLGGIHRNELNSLLPTSVNGWGRERSIACVDSTWMTLVSFEVTA